MKLAPMIKEYPYNNQGLKELEEGESREESKIISRYPTVYVVNDKKKKKIYSVYVGETNNIAKRTAQHLHDDPKSREDWRELLESKTAKMYVIGHQHFNKSMTLDIENQLMLYLSSVENVKALYNRRSNDQDEYYPVNEVQDIFTQIWTQLHQKNSELFPAMDVLKDLAIFKASPFHKLTHEQLEAKNLIMERVNSSLDNDEEGQLIMVTGEAGAGKTVLLSNLFYDLVGYKKYGHPLNVHIMVNHDEQVTVYKQIAKKLGILEKYGNVVDKPTTFINNHTEDNPVDVVFVDEGHLLLTQGKQSYKGKDQLEDIIKRARVTVVMFDENQILTTEQFREAEELEKYRNKAREEDNYIILHEQLRMQANSAIVDWIDAFTKERILKKIPKADGYDIKIFNSPEELDLKIKEKAKKKKSSLSRVIATYDWEYSSIHEPKDRWLKYWEVMVGKWHKPWNRELEKNFSKEEKKQIKGLAWAEQPQTIDEVGSTYTIQGFDLNYAGVILGPSVKYRNGEIIFDPTESHNHKATRNRTLGDGSKQKFGELLIQHEVRVLMTRGVNGVYIYACDEQLREALNKAEG